MTDTTSTTYQNYILYRTADYMYQPGYGYMQGTTPTVPSAKVSSAKGTVIATQKLSSLTGLSVPDGFAYALDADGKYPVGSVYTPPAATS